MKSNRSLGYRSNVALMQRQHNQGSIRAANSFNKESKPQKIAENLD